MKQTVANESRTGHAADVARLWRTKAASGAALPRNTLTARTVRTTSHAVTGAAETRWFLQLQTRIKSGTFMPQSHAIPTLEQEIAMPEEFKKCPGCNGEGYKNPSTVESGQPGTDGHLILMDFEECEVCEGAGDIPLPRS